MQDNCIKPSIDSPDIHIKYYEEINGVIFIRVSPIKKFFKCPKCHNIADRPHDFNSHFAQHLLNNHLKLNLFHAFVLTCYCHIWIV